MDICIVEALFTSRLPTAGTTVVDGHEWQAQFSSQWECWVGKCRATLHVHAGRRLARQTPLV